jgi:hypothetical protein
LKEYVDLIDGPRPEVSTWLDGEGQTFPPLSSESISKQETSDIS